MPITVEQTIEGLKGLTQKMQALQAPAQTINLINGPLIIIGQGPFPPIIAGFTEIITVFTSQIAASQGNTPVEDATNAKKIFEAYREYVKVTQVTLNILIDKAGLFSTVPFIGEPLAALFRQYENINDAYAHGLTDRVKGLATDMQSQVSSLQQTIALAIKQYAGLALS